MVQQLVNSSIEKMWSLMPLVLTGLTMSKLKTLILLLETGLYVALSLNEWSVQRKKLNYFSSSQTGHVTWICLYVFYIDLPKINTYLACLTSMFMVIWHFKIKEEYSDDSSWSVINFVKVIWRQMWYLLFLPPTNCFVEGVLFSHYPSILMCIS